MALRAPRVLPRQPSLNRKVSIIRNHGAAFMLDRAAKENNRV
jgi:hypothetical protein